MALTAVFAAGEVLTAGKLNASSVPIVSADADITTPYTNQVIYNSTSQTLRKYSGSAWAVWHPNTQFISKGSTESVTSSTALQNDDDFAFAVLSNGFYVLEGYVIIDGASAGDFNCDFTVPAGATLAWTNFANTGPDAGTSVTDMNTVIQAASEARKINTLPLANPPGLSFAPRGYLNIGATAGTLQFRWAQGTSNGTATRVQGGSWMKLSRVA